MGMISEILKYKDCRAFNQIVYVVSGGIFEGYEYLLYVNKEKLFYQSVISIPKGHKYDIDENVLSDNFIDVNCPVPLNQGFVRYFPYLGINCHNGIDFLGKKHDLKIMLDWAYHETKNNNLMSTDTFGEEIWIGFSCVGVQDKLDVENINNYRTEPFSPVNEEYLNAYYKHTGWGNTGVVRDIKFVEDECKSIIYQLIAINNGIISVRTADGHRDFHGRYMNKYGMYINE